MNPLRKYKNDILLGVLLLLAFLVSRIIFLGDFPIFTDEALYVRWAQVASQDANWRFISLTDGKQPMLIWIGMIFVKIISDPLVAVRMVSVLAGLGSVIALFLLTLELFKDKRAAYISAILYIAFPFAVVYDRLALYDSLVGMFAIFALYFTVLLVRKRRLDIAYTLGAVIGGGMLTKTSANFSILLLPVALLLFNFKEKAWFKNLLKLGILAVVAVIIGEVFYNSLRLSQFFHIIKEKNSIFIYYPFSIPIEENFKVLYGNARGLIFWLLTYLTPFYAFLILVSVITIKKFMREKILLLLYFSLPFLALALFGKVVFPRFIFFMSLYLLPLASLGLLQVADRVSKFMTERKMNMGNVVAGLVLIFFILYPAKVSLDFIFDPENAALANSDRDQYIKEWPSGGGVSESVEFFKEQAKDQKIFIGTEGTFGLMPYALEIYLADNPNITIKGYWPIDDEIPEDVLSASMKMPTYFIFYQPCVNCEFAGDPPDAWPLELISQFEKNKGVFYSIYKVEE